MRTFLSFLLIVFPTCVGVFPPKAVKAAYNLGLPHMRGGVSRSAHLRGRRLWSSPHAWGCFWHPVTLFSYVWVFPTCVGVFLMVLTADSLRPSLPHMRGGVSSVKPSPPRWSWSSPHAWGCFLNEEPGTFRIVVFPTCVGVFPTLCR